MALAVETICSSQITVATMPSLRNITAGDQQSVAAFEVSEKLGRAQQELRQSDHDVILVLCLTSCKERKRRRKDAWWHPWINWKDFTHRLGELGTLFHYKQMVFWRKKMRLTKFLFACLFFSQTSLSERFWRSCRTRAWWTQGGTWSPPIPARSSVSGRSPECRSASRTGWLAINLPLLQSQKKRKHRTTGSRRRRRRRSTNVGCDRQGSAWSDCVAFGLCSPRTSMWLVLKFIFFILNFVLDS